MCRLSYSSLLVKGPHEKSQTCYDAYKTFHFESNPKNWKTCGNNNSVYVCCAQNYACQFPLFYNNEYSVQLCAVPETG